MLRERTRRTTRRRGKIVRGKGKRQKGERGREERERERRREDKFGTHLGLVTEGSLPGVKIVQGCDRWVVCGGAEWVSRWGVGQRCVEWFTLRVEWADRCGVDINSGVG